MFIYALRVDRQLVHAPSVARTKNYVAPLKPRLKCHFGSRATAPSTDPLVHVTTTSTSATTHMETDTSTRSS
jgi:hypothetical protein